MLGVSPQQRGFGLIELIIVVAIISMLATIAIPVYQDYTIRSQVTAALHDIAGGKSAFESLVVARNLGVFDVAEIGLNSSTTRCQTVTMLPGPDGFIRCTIQGHPKVSGRELTLGRNSGTGKWRCTIDVETRYRPKGCQAP